jgi:hypothetical protein
MDSKLDVTIANNVDKSTKIDVDDERFGPMASWKQTNVNETRQNQEKQILIDNLKTCTSPFLRRETKFQSKEQIPSDPTSNTNIYSDDPLSDTHANNSLFYGYVDIEQARHVNVDVQQEHDEVIYDVINTTNDRILPDEIDDNSIMYAVPKTNH